nr:AAA domain protein [uncultured bacterium]
MREVEKIVSSRHGSTLIAVDGRSGVGKSTFALELAQLLTASVIQGDDFYSGGVLIRRDTPGERMNACIDWQEQRRVLEALREGKRAAWRSFDSDRFDGSLEVGQKFCEPTRFVVLEGVYSARPELSDLLDFRILLTVPHELRLKQLFAREGAIGPWERQWHEAENEYFDKIATSNCFDLVLHRAE